MAFLCKTIKYSRLDMSSSLRAKPVLDDSAYLAYFLGTIVYYTVVVVGNIVLIITHNAQVTLQKIAIHSSADSCNDVR